MSFGRRWTQTAINELRAALDDGLSIDDIVRQLGRSLEDVEQMMARLRLSLRQSDLQG